MKFMVVKIAGQPVHGAVTQSKRQAYSWLASIRAAFHDVNIEAWRYHDGGWRDGSEDAWKHIQELPSTVAVEVYR